MGSRIHVAVEIFHYFTLTFIIVALKIEISVYGLMEGKWLHEGHDGERR